MNKKTFKLIRYRTTGLQAQNISGYMPLWSRASPSLKSSAINKITEPLKESKNENV